MKALVVEDHIPLQEVFTRILTLEKFAVDTAHDGTEAFEKAKEIPYDVILLDIMLPSKTGFEIISGLRALGINSPIIIISARNRIEDRVRGLNLGADDYMVKGFSLQELLARVKTLVRRKTGRRHNIFRCGTLMVDLSQVRVERLGREILLSRKEFGILFELLKRKNQAVSREELKQTVWGDTDRTKGSNVVDANIRYLRKKIEVPFAEKKLIHTVRGYGYMLRDPNPPKKRKRQKK